MLAGFFSRSFGLFCIWGGTVLGAFVLAFVAYLAFIKVARRYFRSGVREYIEDIHAQKGTTPTMGGLVFVGLTALGISIIYWVNSDIRLLSLLFLLVGSALIGAWDDVCKVFFGRGIVERQKLVAQIMVALGALLIWYICVGPLFPDAIFFDLGRTISLPIGAFGFVLWSLWVIVSTYNCVNFTDGLDGLAGGVLAVNVAFFGLFAMVLGEYELALVLAMLLGSIMAFLWFNMHPARIFMGDLGALSAGAVLALIALMLRMELAIVLVGAVFVLEGVSVILQKVWVRLFRQRIFLLAPLHHHFEKCGVPEVQITNRAILFTLLMALFTALLYMLPACW